MAHFMPLTAALTSRVGLAACLVTAPAIPARAIIGGKPSVLGTPQQSVVVSIRLGDQLCTGAFIEKDIVLTAAHCLYRDKERKILHNVDSIKLIFGLIFKEKSKDTLRTAIAIKAHEEYRRNKDRRHDIGLIRFSGGLPAGAATVPFDNQPLNENRPDTVLVIGYGRNESRTGNPGLPKGSGTLREKRLPVSHQDEDRQDFVVDQTGQKTGSPGGICNGDSGGPALAERAGKLFLVGVGSNTFPYGTPQKELNYAYCSQYASYTDIVYYRTWIKQGIDVLQNGKWR